MNDYKYKVFKLCDFSVENDNDIGNFDGDIIAISSGETSIKIPVTIK